MRRWLMAALLILTIAAGGGFAEEDDARIERLLADLGKGYPQGMEALQALIAIGEPSIPGCLAILANADEPAGRRWPAAKVLGAVKAAEALDDLLACVTDEAGSPLAPVAVEAVGRIGDAKALPVLKARLETVKNPMLRKEIERSIAILEGRSPPPRRPAPQRTPPRTPPPPMPRERVPKSPTQPPWVFFASRESDQGPQLVLTSSEGKTTTLSPVADTLLIQYMARAQLGRYQKLSVDEADWNRVLLRFEVPEDADIEGAELVLQQDLGSVEVKEPIHAALHRVMESWGENEASWQASPAFETDPRLRFDLPPEKTEVRVDVTALFAPDAPAFPHGWLLRVAEPGDYTPAPPAPAPTPGSGGATRPNDLVRRLLDLVTWAPDAKSAVERAKKEERPVLALVRATYDPRQTSPAEEIFLACVLANPHVTSVIQRSFVPVRIGYSGATWTIGRPAGVDPLTPLGMSAAKVKPPALVVATADGNVVDRLEGMGTYAPELILSFLSDALDAVGTEPTSSDPAELIRAGRFTAAKALLADVDGAASEYRRALIAYLEGRHEDACDLATEVRGPKSGGPFAREARAIWELAVIRGGLVVREARAGDDDALESAHADEVRYWRGVAALRPGWHDAMKPHFEAIPAGSPWRPKVEAWVRWPARMYGFETPLAPTAQRRAGTTETTLPSVEDATRRGVDNLLALQRPDGSWPNAMRDPASIAPITALAARALFAHRNTADGERAKRLVKALSLAQTWIEAFLEETDAAVANSFGQAYLLDYALDRFAADKAHRAFARKAVAFCLGGQLENGAWSYNRQWGESWRGGIGAWPVTDQGRAHSMNTGPCLVALARAKALGLAVDSDALERGREALLAMRVGPAAFTYTWPEPRNFEDEKVNIGRAPVCEHALLLLEATPREDLQKALDLFMEGRDHLRRVTKVTKGWVPPRAVSSYFPLFAWHHAARALHAVPGEEAVARRKTLREDLLGMAEVDGTWVDWEEAGKAYGTAMALLVLADVD